MLALPRQVDATRAALVELRDAYRSLVRLVAAWIPKVPELEAKLMLGRHLHLDSEAAAALDARLRTLGGEALEAASPSTLVRRLAAISRAEPTTDRLVLLYEDARPVLTGLLRDFLAEADPVWDEPSIEIVRPALAGEARRVDDYARLRVDLDRIFPALAWVSADDARERCPAVDGGIDLSMPALPARDARFTVQESVPPRPSGVPLPVKIVADMHIILTSLEIPTIEACCRNICEFPAMPWDFVRDMARQIWDEVRHAEGCYRRIHELGGSIGLYAADTKLWALTQDQDLALRLAAHQRIGEQIGVDAALFSVADLRAKGELVTAAFYEYVAYDEMTHVAIGNKWISILVGHDAAAVAAVDAAAMDRRDAMGAGINGNLPYQVARWACRLSGFSDQEIDRIEAKRKGPAKVVV